MKPNVKSNGGKQIGLKKKKKNTGDQSVKMKTNTPSKSNDNPVAVQPPVAKQKKLNKAHMAKLKKRVNKLATVANDAPPPQQPPSRPSVAKAKLEQKVIKKKNKQNKQSASAPVAVAAETSLQQLQPKKRKQSPAEVADKRQRIDSPAVGKSGAKASHEVAPPAEESQERPAFLADTEPVRDPVLRAEIADCLRRRAACTVRVSRLPNRLRLAQIGELSRGIQATRVPWNYAAGRNKGVAFLEFPSPEAAERGLAEVLAGKTLGTRLTAAVVAKDADGATDVADLNAFNCSRLVVSSLHPHTTGQELKDLVGGGAVQRVDFLHGSKTLRKSAPAAAFLTFSDERRALDAVKKFQGCVIRGRSTSWFFQKRSDRPEHTRHRTELVAFGVSKRVTDDDILKAFPSSQSIDVRQAQGMAIIKYDTEAECHRDYEACKGGVAKIGKARLRVQYGHAHHKPVEQRRAASQQQQQQQVQNQPAAARVKQPRKEPQAPPKPLNIDPSLFNKSQLVVKNFKPSTQEADLSGFLPGARRVFFTPNRRLAFVHFGSDEAATVALEKLARETLNGSKLKGMYAMDKPDKKGLKQQQQQQQQSQQDSSEPQDVSMTDEAANQEQRAEGHKSRPQHKNKKKLMGNAKLKLDFAGNKERPQQGGIGKLKLGSNTLGKVKAHKAASANGATGTGGGMKMAKRPGKPKAAVVTDRLSAA